MMLLKITQLLTPLASMSVRELNQLSSLLKTLSIAAFSIAGIALIAAIVIWIKLDIKNVIGFLSGKNAAKAIDALLSGKKTYQGVSKGVRPLENVGKGRVGYDSDENKTVPLSDSDRTMPLGGADADETVMLGKSRAGDSNETVMLGGNQTSADPDATQILGQQRPRQRYSPPQESESTAYGANYFDDAAAEPTGISGWDDDVALGTTAPAPEPTMPDRNFGQNQWQSNGPRPQKKPAQSPKVRPELECEETQILTSVWDEEIDIDL